MKRSLIKVISVILAATLIAVCLCSCATRENASVVTVSPSETATPDQSGGNFTGEPFETGTPEITETPDATPTEQVTEEATSTDTPEATSANTPEATSEETPELTEAPTATATPTVEPEITPTAAPTATPTEKPTPTKEPEQTELKTLSGAKYETSGGTRGTGTWFSINRDFVITFDQKDFAKSFNRMELVYSSNAPLKISVKYVLSGKDKTDSFFLDKGDNVTFRGLISSYLSSGKGSAIKSITFNTCKGAKTDFKLIDLKTETIAVYNSDTYYIENSHYKVGVKLSWGGGINYIEDKTCNVSGLKNLINQADTGRLVQQSYYGTAGNSEYTPGEFNGSKWTYNPVQGGDKYGNSSRLIDLEVTATSIYVKAQPQDWSLNGQITPSYMENTYSLQDDCIRVDNRFTDYSGWTHRYAHQELPAFYTVSYLGVFTWYNGEDSWTDAPLSERESLNFWGDAAYADQCRFYVKEKNTETWCAWYNKSSNYGIGLYVPNIDMLYAGRFSYNGSKDSKNGATNYVAPLNTIMMVSYTPIEYSYLITTGNVSQIRSVFKANKDFASNASLHKNYQSMRVKNVDYSKLDFTTNTYMNVIGDTNNATAKYNSTKKALELKVGTAYDPQVFIDYDKAQAGLNASDYDTLTIEYMIPATNSMSSYECDLFICCGSVTGPDANYRHRITFTCDGNYHTATVNLRSLGYFEGDLHKIRFDFFDSCADGEVMYVKSFNLS